MNLLRIGKITLNVDCVAMFRNSSGTGAPRFVVVLRDGTSFEIATAEHTEALDAWLAAHSEDLVPQAP